MTGPVSVADQESMLVKASKALRMLRFGASLKASENLHPRWIGWKLWQVMLSFKKNHLAI